MHQDDNDAVTTVMREGIADIMLKLSKLDRDPIRDARVIATAALSALSSAGYKVVRSDA